MRRIEVFTGAGRRRVWSAQDKARIVAESYGGLESACAVARRYGLAQGQLFAWRREARKAALEAGPGGVLRFAPVVVEPASAVPPAPKREPGRRRRSAEGAIELQIGGVAVRIGRGADARTVSAVIRALKAEQ